MKCQNCGERFPADIGHGGMMQTDSPGYFFVLAVVCGIGTVLLFHWNVALWRWACLGFTTLATLVCGLAWAESASDAYCPRCRRRGRVWPWSF
ncbi:MAG: hypothetical protein K8T90_04620 [Planctomycetes bacterium]|nr:hypothetical protein [Planctomycetota bacterium]